MATTARPLTVDEFRRLPEDKGAVYYELRHGEVVAVVRPKLKHALERERVCLANGAREFRVVDADRRQVKVTTPDGRTVTRQGGDEIPLPFGDRACLNVDDILRF